MAQPIQAIHGPNLYIDVMEAGPHPTIEQIGLIAKLLNDATEQVRSNRTYWGYEGGKGFVLGVPGSTGNFLPLAQPSLSWDQFNLITYVIIPLAREELALMGC